MLYATKPLKCVLFVFVVLVLFQFYSKTTLFFLRAIFSKHTVKAQKPPMFNWGRIGELFINLQISTDFKEMKRLCTFMMPFLYDWVFIFFSI